MEHMKWFDSTIVGVLAANNLGFGFALANGICQTFGEQQCQGDHGMSKISHTEPSKPCNIVHPVLWKHCPGINRLDVEKGKIRPRQFEISNCQSEAGRIEFKLNGI
jgi:hypothetical protein